MGIYFCSLTPKWARKLELLLILHTAEAKCTRHWLFTEHLTATEEGKILPLLISYAIYCNNVKAFCILFKTWQAYQNNWRFPLKSQTLCCFEDNFHVSVILWNPRIWLTPLSMHMQWCKNWRIVEEVRILVNKKPAVSYSSSCDWRKTWEKSSSLGPTPHVELLWEMPQAAVVLGQKFGNKWTLPAFLKHLQIKKLKTQA